MRLTILLILSIFAYTLNANWVAEQRYNTLVKEAKEYRENANKNILNLYLIYAENEDMLFANIHKKVQRIMDIYGTRLVLVEKGVKKYHGVESLEDLTGSPKKKKG